MKEKKITCKIILALTFISLSATHATGQLASDNGLVFVEAKVWNKRHPELPQWQSYPALTVDSLCCIPKIPDRLNRYGSLLDGPLFEATGFFYATRYHDRWIMVDPDGRLHIDAAVVGVRLGQGEQNKSAFSKKFQNEDEWIKQTVDKLTSYGFNGAGTWSNEKAIRRYNQLSTNRKFTYCPILSLMSGYNRKVNAERHLPENAQYPNQCIRAFDPEFEEYCDQYIASIIDQYKADPNVLGFYSDNELPISSQNLEGYLNLPEDDWGHKAAVKWLEAKGVTWQEITDALRYEFAGYVADTYFGTVRRSLKKFDPNHMYLGSRLHWEAKNTKEVIAAAGRHCDVITINYYGYWQVRGKDIADWKKWADKPFMITEFYTKAEDSGLTNATGAGWLVHTQKDRGFHYENFVIGLLKASNCVGWSWFRYQDNDPTSKAADPSNLNSNKGCFDNSYEPYVELVSRMGQVVNSIRYSLAGLF